VRGGALRSLIASLQDFLVERLFDLLVPARVEVRNVHRRIADDLADVLRAQEGIDFLYTGCAILTV
jgi:hypothetical protein